MLETQRTETLPALKKLIYLLDDEPTLRVICIKMLRHIGYEPEAFDDGEELLQAYQAKPCDLAILDLSVPCGLGGVETLAQLKKISPAIKALVASGHSEGPIVSDPSAYGFIGSLCKPFGMNDLRSALRLALGG